MALLVLVASGLIALTYRLLATNPAAVQYLQVLFGFIALLMAFFAIRVRPRPKWSTLWPQLQMSRCWQLWLLALATGIWTVYFLLPEATSLVPSEAMRSPYTVQGVCALAVEHPSLEELTEFLSAKTEQQARDYFGGAQVRRTSGLDLVAGKNLSEVCLSATFEVIETDN